MPPPATPVVGMQAGQEGGGCRVVFNAGLLVLVVECVAGHVVYDIGHSSSNPYISRSQSYYLSFSLDLSLSLSLSLSLDLFLSQLLWTF